MSASVTIGLPVFNAERYIEGAIRSVLDQTFTDLELLIADNASTDRTLDIAQKAAASDARVRILPSDVNRGISWNWNRLVTNASGEYFRWACYDDILHPELVAQCLKVLEDSAGDVIGCYPRTTDIDASGEVVGVYDDDLDLTQATAHERLAHLVRDLRRAGALFSLLRLDALRSTRLFGRFGHPDHVVLAELVLRGRLMQLPDRLFYRRTHDGNTLTTHRTFADMARLHDPTLQGDRFYPWNRVFGEHLRAIAQAPVDAAEKARCVQVLFTNWWLYDAMAGEVKQNALSSFRKRQERRHAAVTTER